MTLDDLRQKYPMNSRGFTVIPTIALSPDTMEDWMIGLRVTIGLVEVGVPTEQGNIVKFNSTHVHVKVGAKTKKVEYHPDNLVLCVYQFDERILFSNEVVARRQPQDVEVEKPSLEPEGQPKVETPPEPKPEAPKNAIPIEEVIAKDEEDPRRKAALEKAREKIRKKNEKVRKKRQERQPELVEGEGKVGEMEAPTTTKRGVGKSKLELFGIKRG